MDIEDDNVRTPWTRTGSSFRRTMRSSKDWVSEAKVSIISATGFLFSRTALKAYLRLYIYAVVSVFLLGVAVWTYWLFYNHYIPHLSHTKPVYFQFNRRAYPDLSVSAGDAAAAAATAQRCQSDLSKPYGIVDISDTNLFNDQRYNMILHLDMPTSPLNRGVGNVMVDCTIHGGKLTGDSPLVQEKTYPRGGSLNWEAISDLAVLQHTSRPTMMTYRSEWIDIAQKLAALPLYIVGWFKESEDVKVLVMEDFKFSDWTKPPSAISLKLDSPTPVQIYGATIEIVAQLDGLRYAMYHRFVPTSIFFIMALWSMGLTTFLIGTLLLSSIFAGAELHRSQQALKNADERSTGHVLGLSPSTTPQPVVPSERESRITEHFTSPMGGRDQGTPTDGGSPAKTPREPSDDSTIGDSSGISRFGPTARSGITGGSEDLSSMRRRQGGYEGKP